MLWGCFSWNGVGPLVKIVGNMDATYYVGNILETVMLPYAEEEKSKGVVPIQQKQCFGVACTITGPQSNRAPLDRC